VQNYNHILGYKNVSNESAGSTTEPVSLEEMKSYMRISGFVDDNDSTAIDEFTDDDLLIEELITSAREGIEKYTGLALIPKEMRVVLTNLAGMQELPWGPHGEVSEVLYENDTEDTGDPDYKNRLQTEPTVIKFIGPEFKHLKCPRYCNMIIQYTCGYGTDGVSILPRRLKEAIMKECLYRYEHRGDELNDTGVCASAKRLAGPYRRLSWLV
jgi:uncharacterized phiE125 gp8 family phage protein